MTDAEKPKCRAFKVDGTKCRTDAIAATELKYCGSHKTKESRAKGLAVVKAKKQAQIDADMTELLGTATEQERTSRRSETRQAKAAGLLDSPAVALGKCEDTFRRWLGPAYDMQALRITLIVAAVERMDGDPLWVLIVSGPGNAKTETVMPAEEVGAVIVSDISGTAALLSGSPEAEKGSQATGGILQEMGSRGMLVFKDFTSILSLSGDKRLAVLGALREVFDGQWSRALGTDGGITLEWRGRVVAIGGVTTAWDKHHAVIAVMGDRFALLRVDSDDPKVRRAVSRQAFKNTGKEAQMRHEMKVAFGAVIDAADTDQPTEATEDEVERLLDVADLVTKARTAVEREFNGDVEFAHAQEVGTRFGKQLLQVLRGGVAIGMDRQEAMRLAVRVGRDSLPPLRLRIIDHLAEHATETEPVCTRDIYEALKMPRKTVDRELQALALLGVVERFTMGVTGFTALAEDESTPDAEQTKAKGPSSVWAYCLADSIHPKVLKW